MNYWLLLVLLSLTVYRVTRLIVRDTFPPIVTIRTKIYRLGHRTEWVDSTIGSSTREVATRWEWLAELVTCHWCASGWVALGATTATWLAVDGLPVPILWWFASWSVGALTLHYERTSE